MPYDTTSLAGGVSSGLDSYFKGLKERKDREKKESDEYDALSTLYEAYGLGSRDQAKTRFNLPQLRGTLEGAVVKSAQAKQAQQSRLMEEQIDHYRRLGKQREEQSKWMAALGKNYNLSGPTETGEPMGGDLLPAAMAATRQVPGGASPEFLAGVMHYGRNAQVGTSPSMAPLRLPNPPEGFDVLYGHGGQFQGFAKPTVAGAAGAGPVKSQAIVDEDENPIPGLHGVWVGNKLRIIRENQAPKETGMDHDMRVKAQNAVAKIDSEIQDLQEKIAKHGPDEKTGPNSRWNIFFSTLSDQLKEKITEREKAVQKLRTLKPAANASVGARAPASAAPVDPNDPAGLFQIIQKNRQPQ